MEKGREGRDSGSEVWDGDSKRSGCDKYGVGGRGQEKKMELGGDLGMERDIGTRGKRWQDIFVSLPLP